MTSGCFEKLIWPARAAVITMPRTKAPSITVGPGLFRVENVSPVARFLRSGRACRPCVEAWAPVACTAKLDMGYNHGTLGDDRGMSVAAAGHGQRDAPRIAPDAHPLLRPHSGLIQIERVQHVKSRRMSFDCGCAIRCPLRISGRHYPSGQRLITVDLRPSGGRDFESTAILFSLSSAGPPHHR